MAITKFTDMQLPANWTKYITQATTEKSVFFSSGVLVNNPSLKITEGGQTVNVPHFNPLSATVQLLRDDQSLVANKVTSGKQVGIINARGQVFSENDLASGYSGEDILGYIASQLGTYWGGEMDNHAIAVIKGALEASTANVYDISALTGADAVFSAKGVIKAQHKLGDARSKLSVIIQHSDVTAKMEENDLITYIPESDGKSVYAAYRGVRILETDKLAPTGDVYEQILAGAGAVSFAEGMDLLETEYERDGKAGVTDVITRRSYVLHPNGFSWTGTVGSPTPSNEDFADGSNWTKVFETKNIPLVGFKFKLD